MMNFGNRLLARFSSLLQPPGPHRAYKLNGAPPDFAQHRLELAHFGKLLHQSAFVAATDGNLSVRTEEGFIVATPTNMSKGMMRPDDMVVIDGEGRKVEGTRDVSSEIEMHLTIYRMRPDIRAIVHAHPCTATGFASAGMALDQPLCSEVVVTLGAVPLAPYATPGTPELSEALKPYIPDHEAILMANHGVVTYGSTVCEAYMRMEAVEHFARIVLVAKQLGREECLDKASIGKLLLARERYYRRCGMNAAEAQTRPAGPHPE